MDLARVLSALQGLDKTAVSELLAAAVLGLAVLIAVYSFARPGPTANEDISPALKKEQRNSSNFNLLAAAEQQQVSKATGGLFASLFGQQIPSAPPADEKVLNPAVFKPFKLLSATKISHNTKLLRFEIPHGRKLGLPIGRHISVRADIDKNSVIRAYTPTSRPDQSGYFDLLVKSYETGKLSPHLHSLKVGQSLDVRGPVGRFKYAKNNYRHIGLVAGGTGLTPCLQLVRCVLEGPEGEGDETSFTLLFQNRTVEDILMRDVLDALQAKHPTRFTVHYYLSNCDSAAAWESKAKRQHTGYIRAEDVSALLAPAKAELVCLCGPEGFNTSMKALLEAAGHGGDSLYIW